MGLSLIRNHLGLILEGTGTSLGLSLEGNGLSTEESYLVPGLQGTGLGLVLNSGVWVLGGLILFSFRNSSSAK